MMTTELNKQTFLCKIRSVLASSGYDDQDDDQSI